MLTRDAPPTGDLRPARPAPPAREQAAPGPPAASPDRAPTSRRPGPTPGRPQPNRPARRRPPAGVVLLLVVVALLNLAGLVMVLSASSIASLRQFGSPWHFFARQLLWLAIGGVAFGAAFTVHHQWWRRVSRLAMCGTVAALLAVLVPGIGVSASGASRWLGAGSLQIQPSEVAKLVLVVYAADVLDRRAGHGTWRYQMGPVILVLLGLVGLIMLQPDMGTSMVLACIALAVLFTAGMPLRAVGGLVGSGVGGALLLAVAAPYRWRRMTSFLNPFKDPSNTGYQAVQGLLALSHGRVIGDGLGSSIASYGYLPNAQTDFIFAIIGEETGLVGGMVVSGLFLVVALLGVRMACRAPTRYGALLAAGVTAWLAGQAVINIGAVVGLLPVTGVPLPFVSFGGSSLVIALFGVGLLANVARHS